MKRLKRSVACQMSPGFPRMSAHHCEINQIRSVRSCAHDPGLHELVEVGEALHELVKRQALVGSGNRPQRRQREGSTADERAEAEAAQGAPRRAGRALAS